VWFLRSAAGESHSGRWRWKWVTATAMATSPNANKKRKLISGGCKLSDSQIRPQKTTLAILRKLSLQELQVLHIQ
jgi:hypothetical protein